MRTREFKAGDKVRHAGSHRRGTVLAVVQGTHAGMLKVDIPTRGETWGHYHPTELRLVMVAPIRPTAAIDYENWVANQAK